MANTTLRAYLDELNTLLDKEALEEVIGHCKYILQKFPKNVAVYRLLGRALLGKGRPDEARQVFEQVLSAVPDDYAAHVSMSEIFQEQNAIAQATWHMERAYEQQPNNEALQDVLRDLYARRDGKAPDRIQLTRGALARLYAKGQLYEQATAELQVALDLQPDRYDLLILLADTLWNNAHPVEAGETALKVLQKLPDALEANRLLAQLWLQNQRPSDAEPFLKRVEAVDPFVALQIIRPDDPKAGEKLTLPRLDWNARTSAAMLTNTPDWVEGIGDIFDQPAETADSDPFKLDRKPGSSTPDWAANFNAPTAAPVEQPDWFAQTPTPAPEASAAPNLADMPDWFTDVASPMPEAASNTSDNSDMPSWLDDEPIASDEPDDTSRMPSGFTGLLNEISSNRRSDGSAPSWLDDAPPQTEMPAWDEVVANTAPAASAADTEEDWLSGFTNDTDAPASFAPTTESATTESASVPDWMSDFAPSTTAEPAASAAPVANDTAEADWLSDFTSDAENVPVSAESVTPDSASVPDWMSDFAPSTTAEPVASAAPVANDTAEADWLSDFTSDAENVPVSAESVTPDSASVPDWMSDFAPSTTAEPAASAANTANDTAEADWLSDFTSDAENVPVSAESVTPDSASVPDWMSDFAPSTTAEPAASAANTANDTAEADWLSGFTSDAENVPVSAESVTPDSASVPDWMSDFAPSATSEPVASTANAANADDDWLSGFTGDTEEMSATEASSVKAPTPDAFAWVQPEASTEDDWLSSFEPQTAEQTAQTENNWLDDLAVTDQPVSSVSGVADEINWLTDAPTADVQDSEVTVDNWLGKLQAAQEPASTESSTWFNDAPADDEPAEEQTTPAWLTADANDQFSELLKSASQTAKEPRVMGDTGVLDPGKLPDWINAFSDQAVQPAQGDTSQAADMFSSTSAEPAATEVSYDWLNDTPAQSPAEPTLAEAMRPVDRVVDNTSTAQAGLPIEANFDPETVPDWLSAFAPADDAALEANAKVALPAEETAEDGRIPDWLNDIAPSSGTSEAAPQFAKTVELDSFDFDTDDFGTETADAQSETAETQSDMLPDWLSDAQPDNAAARRTPTVTLDDMDFGDTIDTPAKTAVLNFDDIDFEELSPLAETAVTDDRQTHFTFNRPPAWLRKLSGSGRS